MSEMTTYRWTFEEDVLAYRARGIESIGVWRKKLEEYGEERGAELLREQGLTVSSLSFAGGFTGADGHSFQEAIDDGLDAVRIAGEIGAECLIVVAGARAGHTTNHARRLVRDALLCLGDFAADVGVQVVVQPLHKSLGGHWSFLHATEATADLLARCDHAHVGMALDLFHMGREQHLLARIPQLARWVRTVLVSDAPANPRHDHDRCLPGQGVLPLGALVQALEASGYSGWYDMQLVSDGLWSRDYNLLLGQIQEAFRELYPIGKAAASLAASEVGSPENAGTPAIPCPTDS